jgi:hypothetical protein
MKMRKKKVKDSLMEAGDFEIYNQPYLRQY